MSDAPLLRLSGVSKHFPAVGSGGPLQVLRDVDLEVARGEALAVVGPSGSGKSTLLNVIGALDRPTSGRVVLAGRELTEMDADALARVRNREIGFVFQSHHLLPQCTALENVLVPTLVLDDAQLRAAAPDRARGLLERVGLGQRLDHRPAQLSGGECQRVAVVRALVNRPALLLADEPTGSLDVESAGDLGGLLLELNREQGVALILVTHSEQLASRMQRVLAIHDGRLEPFTAPV
jgi:predicted ABC-type transport system involved in lysophospholipase L1 biosynthesis ATPase subunit